MSEIYDIEELREVNLPINLKLIQKYQRSEPSIVAKYIDGMYHKRPCSGGSNTDLKLILCKDNNIITVNTPKFYIKLVPYVYP